ncbi:MAG TPA: glycosyl hydrolase [Negativicutes bacterium]|nr:glycosyl hydrolase [Negativicutes bacterium]
MNHKKLGIALCSIHLVLLTCYAAAPVAAASPVVPTTWYINGQPAQSPPEGSWQDVKKINSCESQPGYQRFTDYPNGYSVCLPSGLQPDFSLSAVRSSFANKSTQIEIYHDIFSSEHLGAWEYTVDANVNLLSSKRNRITTRETIDWDGFTVNRIKWDRAPLTAVPGDRNYYASLELQLLPSEYYTIFIKSSSPITNDLDILHSFRWTAPRGAAQIFRKTTPAKAKLNEETRRFVKEHFGPGSSLRWGLFDYNAPDNLQSVLDLESRLGYKFTFLLRYQSLADAPPIAGLENAYTDGRYTELSMETTHPEANNALRFSESQINREVLYDILDGKYDSHFREYAQTLKKFGHPVLFRFDNEMNGDWCWYSATFSGKDTDIYKAVWRHVHGLFDEVGVDNVLWVWNPNDLSFPRFKWNEALMYYPGDDVVDIVGLTGYNTGTYFASDPWREFPDIYQPLYANYSAWFDKPFIIGEFGSNSVGGDKVAWINKMFREMPKFNRIKVAIWWSGIDWDENGRPGRIYKLDETPATEDAFRRGLKNYTTQK